MTQTLQKSFSPFPTTLSSFVQHYILLSKELPYFFCSIANTHQGLPYGGFKGYIAGSSQSTEPLSAKDFFLLKEDWAFGLNSFEEHSLLTSSSLPAIFEEEKSCFFIPDWVIEYQSNGFIIHKGEPPPFFDHQARSNPIQVSEKKAWIKKEEYLENLNKIKEDLRQGNYYEINYCIPFSTNWVGGDLEESALLLFESDSPFSCYFSTPQLALLSASPERFFAKKGTKLLSQPIKGTAKRGSNSDEDAFLKTNLRNSPKEQAENRMIVDLVRNDLAKISKSGSVFVEELFGIYSYKNVHQMISTIISDLQDGLEDSEIFQSLFPMGSMTGAPKKAVLEAIVSFEKYKRGWYSGAIGYKEPNGDLDFSVVIRSLVVHKKERKLLWWSGSAITYDSQPEEEWEEIQLKAQSVSLLMKK